MMASRGIGIAAALTLIVLGAVVFALFGARYAANESGLESYLMALQQKQLEYFTKRRVYASTLEAPKSIGLASVTSGFSVTRLESAGNAFCWAGQVLGDPVRFTVSRVGVKRSSKVSGSCE